MLRFIVSISLLLCSFASLAQESDSTVTKKVKEPLDWTPTIIRVGIDAVGLTKSFTMEGYRSMEVSGEIAMAKYLFSLDLGNYSHSFSNTAGTDPFQYKTSGTFFRLGADANFMTKDPDNNAAFFGIRYGRALFNETLDYTFPDPVSGSPANYSASNTNYSAGWGEFALGLRVKVLPLIYLGYTVRYKFALGFKDSNTLIPYEVPGYGPSFEGSLKNSYWGFNYYVAIGIPLKRRG